MSSGIPVLNHEEQQAAVERIHALMQDGMSSGEAIALVAAELREQHKDGEQVCVLFDEDDADDYVTDDNATDNYKSDDYDDDGDGDDDSDQ